MCDYSLEIYTSRPAKAGEDLTISRFPSGSVGLTSEGAGDCAVCVTEGTVLRLQLPSDDFGFSIEDVLVTKIEQGEKWRHHDAVKAEDGTVHSFQYLRPYTKARVMLVADAAAPEDKTLVNDAPVPAPAYDDAWFG